MQDIRCVVVYSSSKEATAEKRVQRTVGETEGILEKPLKALEARSFECEPALKRSLRRGMELASTWFDLQGRTFQTDKNSGTI